jgi:glutamate synthase (NADPH/NADH) large chain
MLTTGQLEPFFPDLSDRRFATELAIVHSRFSTNTFPSWPLAHPFRMIAHNGEINTVKGNRNWMRARESQLVSDVIPGDLDRIFPVCAAGASDSASFDEVLELLHLGGRSLPHAVLMMIPEAWENHAEMDQARRAFYEFHSMIMEPWDGPACVSFTDGTLIGAVLDRNGLRPSRYWVTEDGLVVLASEVGVLDIDPAASAVRLLHAALRPGHEPSPGRDPRGARDLAAHGARARGQPAHGNPDPLSPARARLPGDRQRRTRQDRAHQRGRRPARLRDRAPAGPLPGRRWR